jgi:hypothetical protein
MGGMVEILMAIELCIIRHVGIGSGLLKKVCECDGGMW